MRHIPTAGLLVAAASAAAIAGCGERREVTTGAGAQPRPAQGATAAGAQGHLTLVGVSACLNKKGLVARRRGGRAGTHLEVNASGGRVSVYVFGSKAEAARRRESIAVGSKTSGGSVLQSGSAITVTPDGVAHAVSAKIRTCLS